MTPPTDLVAEFMKSKGFRHRPANNPIFWVNDAGAQIYVSDASYWYQLLLEVRIAELNKLLVKDQEDPSHALDIPDYVGFHITELQTQLAALGKERQ